jgi:hypothetical protein
MIKIDYINNKGFVRKGTLHMIKNSDIKERLDLLIGKELNSENLHAAVFCEEKHNKIRRRFDVGTHTYIQFQIKGQEQLDIQSFANITISGNPNTFRVGIEEKDGKVIINSESRISYAYLP